MATAPKPAPDAAPASRGCFFYGCAGCLALLAAVCVIAAIGLWALRSAIVHWTDDHQAPMPAVTMSDEDYDALKARAQAFRAAVQGGTAAEPLVLTSDDLNALISRGDPTGKVAQAFHVSLEGSEVRGQLSLPLDPLGWLCRGRYLNGDATLKVSLENGVLIAVADEVRVKGQLLPQAFLSGLKQQNLAQNVYKDPKTAEMLRHVESLEVEDGRMILKARAGP